VNSSTDRKQVNMRRTMDVDEVAAVLGIGRSTAYKLVATHVIPAIRLGNRVVISTVEIERLLGLSGGIGHAGPSPVDGARIE